MKWLIASDIHGSAEYCARLVERYEAEGAERMLLLGDLLYHGPRNDLPGKYNPKEVIEMLNAMVGEILCVRGNCDAEVDQMVLNFPIMADYAVIDIGGHVMIATHGHKYSEANPLPLKAGDVVVSGHTHVPKCTEIDGVVYLNPGSVSIPKGGSEHSYMIFEDGVFIWKNISGKEYKRFEYRGGKG